MSDRGWLYRKDGRPPDDDDRCYRWDQGRGCWVDVEEPEIDEDALEAWEERRRERIAEANEY